MKAVILLATLKKTGLSHTQVLCEFLANLLQTKDVETEIIKLVNYNILPGTYSQMGQDDDWPKILNKILAAQILIFATPIWWGNHSSEMQKTIERLDELHDQIMAGQKSALEGKVGGIVITGDYDGVQHITGSLSNFFHAIGLVLPPYASLPVLWEGQKKGAKTSRQQLFEKYRQEYTEPAEIMVSQLLKFAKI